MTAGKGGANSNSRKPRLELTWIGKDERPRLEPRILLPQAELSYGKGKPGDGGIHHNMLIHGDNLLALKALEQDFSGQVKCIYVDPPFNTQQAIGDYYDDGVEHSLWLSLMRDRLDALKRLLRDDGSIFIHIDDNELGYLIALADEVFGRGNRAYIVTFRQASATGHKSINPGCVKTTNFILIYAKDKSRWQPNRLFTGRDRDVRYNQFIANKEDDYQKWQMIPLSQAFAKHLGLSAREAKAIAKKQPELVDRFVMDNADRVAQMVRPDYESVSKEARAVIDQSESDPSRWYHLPRDDHSDFYLRDGQRAIFYSGKLKLVDGQYVSGEPLTTLWDDILSNNLHKEGGVDFPKSKKPEALIKRCIELTTAPGEIVLDSFAGSGTTGAAAHKLKRRWIMVEQGEHALSHVVPRMRRVVDGLDDSGITEPTGWKGGGGFRFYKLAPSLIEEDQFGQKIISKQYKPEMLAEAMCKHMGYTYAPSQDLALYWQQGYGTERDFIFTTTQSLAHDALKALSLEVGADRHLLICCKAFRARLSDFPNLTVKKIPQAVLDNCEWGRDDYSFSIAKPVEDNTSDSDDGPDDDDGGNGADPAPRRRGQRRVNADAPTAEARAAPVKKAPLKMDGTTRQPRVRKSSVVPFASPPVPVVTKAKPKKSESTSAAKQKRKGPKGKPPSTHKPMKAPNRKHVAVSKARRSADNRQGRLL